MDELYPIIKLNAGRISMGVLVFFLLWETLAPFFPFFRRHFKQRFWHTVLNLVMGVINGLLIAFVFVSLWTWAARTAADHQIGLLHWIELPGWGAAIAAILLFDIWTYWWHRMNHRVPFFWRFHRVHHSDPRMDVTTANRFHFGEIALSSALRIPLFFLFGAELWHLALYEAIMFPIVQFHHSNVALPPWLDRFLRVFIVTPGMHKVHHSRLQPETDSNYTSLLSIWDRVFRSFRTRANLREIELGLEGYDEPRQQSLWGLLRTPLDRLPRPRQTEDSTTASEREAVSR